MDVADLLREMNEEFTKGQVEVVKLDAFDYLSWQPVEIQVSRNKYTFELNPMVPVRLTREFNTDPENVEDDLDPEDHNLRSQGVIYRRSRQEEVRAREDFLLREKSRIQQRIELASPRDKQERLQYEIDNYNRKRTVPDFNELIRIYNARYPKYEAPTEWWLDEVYADNIILEWLQAFEELKPQSPSEKKAVVEKLDSSPVLGMLLVLSAPDTEGKPGVTRWLTELGYSANKTGAVYKEFRDRMAYDQEYKMTRSVKLLEKLKRLITDVHPQFKRHLTKINSYLKQAKKATETRSK